MTRLIPSQRARTVILGTLFAFTTFFVQSAPTDLPLPRPEALTPEPVKALACADEPSFEGRITSSSGSTTAITESTTGNVYGYISEVVDDWSCTAYYRYDGLVWSRSSTGVNGNWDWGNLINSTSVPCNWSIGETNYLKANSSNDCHDSDAEYAMPIFLAHTSGAGELLEAVYHNDTTPDELGDFGFIHSDCTSYYGGESISWNEPFTTSNVDSRPGDNCDPYLLESTNTTQTIVVDETAPANGSIVINGGNSWTNSMSVTLTLSATDNLAGLGEMRFSNDGTNWGSWVTYATSAAWTLSSGDGTKTVYAQFRDANGNATTGTGVSDTVGLDTSAATPNPPDVSCTTVTDAVYQAAANATCFFRSAAASTVTLTASASDAQSGISYLRFQNLTPATGWTPTPGLPNDDTSSAYIEALAFSGSAVSATIGILARNVAGTDTSVRTITLTSDTAVPTTTFTLPAAGTNPWPADSVAVTWTESDGSGAGVKTRSLKRQTATWDGTTCATFADDAAFTPSSATSPVNDPTILADTCYRWVQTLTDQVGNVLATTSGVIVPDSLANLGMQNQHTFESWDLGAGDSLATNVVNGNAVVSHPILALPIRGSSVAISATYNAKDQTNVGLGPGWRLDVGRRLQSYPDGSVTFIDESGARHTFTSPQTAGAVTTYSRPATLYATLVKDTGQSVEYTLTYKDRSLDTFDIVGTGARLIRAEDRFDNGVTLAYTGDNLATITDAAPSPDRVIDFTWNTAPAVDQLTTITDWVYVSGGVTQSTATGARRAHRFFYDGSGNLSGWADPVDTSGSCSTPASHRTCLTYTSGLLAGISKTQSVTTLTTGTLGTATPTITTEIDYSGSSVSSVTDAEQQAQGSPQATTFSQIDSTTVEVERPTTTTSYVAVAADDPYARVGSVLRRWDGSTDIETRTVWDTTYPTEPASITANHGAVLSTPARTTSYTYVASSLGNLAKIVEPLTGSDDRWTEFTYNSNDDVTQQIVSLEGSGTERTITRYCYTSDSGCSTSATGLAMLRQIDNYQSGETADEDTNVAVEYTVDAYGQVTRTTRHNKVSGGSTLDDRADGLVYDDKGNTTSEITNYDDGVVTPDSDDTTPDPATGARTDLTTTHGYDTAGNRISSADPRRAIVDEPAAYAADAFGRTVSDGWGSADIGGSWSNTNADFDVASGVGTVSLSSATDRNAYLTSVSAADQELLVKMRVDRLSAGSVPYWWIFLRRQDSSNYYQARVKFMTNGTLSVMFLRTGGGSESIISEASTTVPHATTDWYWLRARLTGTTSVNAKMKVWREGTTEPATWALDATDASAPAALQGSGHTGVRFQIPSGYTAGYPLIGSLDDFSLTGIGGGTLGVDDYVSRWTYDALDQQISSTTPTTPAVATAQRTSTTTYDEFGLVRSATDFGGVVSATEYDRAGRAIQTFEDPGASDPAAATSETTYDADGKTTAAKDRNQVGDPDLGQTTTTYDALGRPESVIAAAGSDPDVSSETRTTYDALDRVTVTEVGYGSASSQRTELTLDLGSRATETDDGFACTTSTFDYRDLPLVVTDSLDTSTCSANADSRETTNEYDGLGRLIETEVTDGPNDGDKPRIATYDAAGNTLTSADLTATVTTTTTFTLNPLDEVLVEERADGSTASTTYDAAANPVDRCTWAAGIDVGDCLAAGTTGWVDPPTSSTTTTWDARNGRIGLADATTNQTTVYDPDDLYQPSAIYTPTKADLSVEQQTLYAYDERHRLESITHRLCTVSSGHACSSTTATGSVAYEYDDNNSRTRVIEANGSASTDYQYCHDALDQLIGRGSTAACDTSSIETFTYDEAGNRTQAVEGGTTRNFAYAATGLLCDVETGSAADCSGGNITSDDAGRISDQAGWHYLYDAEGRLVSVCEDADCVGSGFNRVDFTYDGEGHRTAILATPASGSPVETTFRYAGDAIVAEYVDGDLTREYTTDSTGTITKVTVPFGETDAGIYLVTWNGHGDAMALWRQNGDGSLTLANSYTYGTWGTPTTATLNSISDLGFRFLYVGAFDVQWDSAYGLDLLYMHARHYSPSLGRFLQPDPSALEAQLFVYARNGPVAKVDPSGKLCFVPIVGWIACAAAVVVYVGATVVVSLATVHYYREWYKHWWSKKDKYYRDEPRVIVIAPTPKRILEKELKAGGYRKIRDTGDHEVWGKKGERNVSLPRHKDISPGVTRDIRRQIEEAKRNERHGR